MEHYCTLFSINYLPLGMALHASLEKHAAPYTLWVLCMDEEVEHALVALALPSVRWIPLREFEAMFPRLQAVRPNRAFGEYCWNCTPFLPEAVFRKAPEVPRVTYLCADVYLFAPLDGVLREFEASGADTMVTEHGFSAGMEDPEGGRFCVQLLPFKNNVGALEILSWWQERCLEWCHAWREPGRFGDQKYLERWPDLFGNRVHILSDISLTLACWNINRFWGGGVPRGIYHFHGLRLFADGEAMLYPSEYVVKIPLGGLWSIYLPYVQALREAWTSCRAHGVVFHHPPAPHPSFFVLRRFRRFLLRIQCWVRVDRSPWLSFCGWSPFGK